ncbi:hypothetical protein ACYSNU_17730 [Enterococcus sp. LJL120]
MKIVLNKCFGGFGLSHKAKMEIFKRKGIIVFPYTHIWNSKSIDRDYWERYEGQKLGSSLSQIYYLEKDPDVENFVMNWEDVSNKFGFVDDDYDETEMRNDETLVTVVEELGDEADGSFANLKVVEIPEGVDWEISDYDGVETAHYGFQAGSV